MLSDVVSEPLALGCFVFEAFLRLGLFCILAFVWAIEVMRIQDSDDWNLNNRLPFFFTLSKESRLRYTDICTMSYFHIPNVH